MIQAGFAADSATKVLGDVRVLALIDHFAQGGAELLISRFAAGAPGVGIDLSVACLTETRGNPAAEPLRAVGVSPVVLDARERLGLSSLLTVRDHLAQVRPDIVHTHLGSSDVLGSLAARSLGIPAVSTLHNPAWGGDRRERLKRSLAAAARRWGSARLIAVSEHARSEYLERGWDVAQRVVTVYNGIDVSAEPGQGAIVRQELGLTREQLVVGMVSAMRPVKGHRIAVEAIALLRNQFPNLRLVIVGDGAEFEAVKRQSRALDGAVVMARSRTDVMRVLDAFDIFLHPSYADPFPGSVLEAMAASLPVVGTAVGGIPEQIEHGRSGVLVPAPPQPESIAHALADLLGDPARRRALGEAARRRYEARFTAGPWLAGTRAVYDEVLAALAEGRRGR